MTFPKELKEVFTTLLTINNIAYSVNGWSNYMELANNPGAITVTVKNEDQVHIVMQTIKQLNVDRNPDNKITVRAAAGWSDTSTENGCCFFPWASVQENQYNESFSFSQVVGGRASNDTSGTDVIIRFDKKYHNMKVIGPLDNPNVFNPESPIHQLPASLVEVSAGVQIGELSDYLRKHDLSLSTASMIAWVTAVGLAGTGGHGTGRDESGFSGLIESMKICDMDGIIREINRNHPDFAILCGAHSGLLGVVLSIKLRAVQAFNLEETIKLYQDAKSMTLDLDDILKNNEYVSIMGMPSYQTTEIGKAIPKWQVKMWNFTTKKPTQKTSTSYHPDLTSYMQELEIKMGAPIMEYLLDPALKHLFPLYTNVAAAMVIETRGAKTIVDYENKITHPQVAFPKTMRDVSYQIPLKDGTKGETAGAIFQKIESMLDAAGSKGQYPLTYAFYGRYFKGTNGGLSTSFTSGDDEHIFALDMVTHPKAYGINEFEQEFVPFLTHDLGIQLRCHLGKNFPAGMEHYDQFLGADNVNSYIAALERWHNSSSNAQDGADRLARSPFLTPYLKQMLSPSPEKLNVLTIDKQEDFAPTKVERHSRKECEQFMETFTLAVSLMPLQSKVGKAAKEALLEACKTQTQEQLMII